MPVLDPKHVAIAIHDAYADIQTVLPSVDAAQFTQSIQSDIEGAIASVGTRKSQINKTDYLRIIHQYVPKLIRLQLHPDPADLPGLLERLLSDPFKVGRESHPAQQQAVDDINRAIAYLRDKIGPPSALSGPSREYYDLMDRKLSAVPSEMRKGHLSALRSWVNGVQFWIGSAMPVDQMLNDMMDYLLDDRRN